VFDGRLILGASLLQSHHLAGNVHGKLIEGFLRI